jgi:hypothetical protein
VHAGDEEPVGRAEVNPHGKAVKAGSVGAIAGRGRNDDYRVGSSKEKDRTTTLGECISVEGAHYNTIGRKYCRKECVGKRHKYKS